MDKDWYISQNQRLLIELDQLRSDIESCGTVDYVEKLERLRVEVERLRQYRKISRTLRAAVRSHRKRIEESEETVPHQIQNINIGLWLTADRLREDFDSISDIGGGHAAAAEEDNVMKMHWGYDGDPLVAPDGG